MYTLRKIFKDGSESNKIIGDSYLLISDDNVDFDKSMEVYFKGDAPKEHEIYLFLSHEDGKRLLPLYKTQQNFIVSDSGKTFSNLTHFDLRHELKWGKKNGNEVIPKESSFMYEQLHSYSDDHLFPVSDIKRLIALSHTGNAEWAPKKVF